MFKKGHGHELLVTKTHVANKIKLPYVNVRVGIHLQVCTQYAITGCFLGGILNRGGKVFF